jgi:hypothetical protein
MCDISQASWEFVTQHSELNVPFGGYLSPNSKKCLMHSTKELNPIKFLGSQRMPKN